MPDRRRLSRAGNVERACRVVAHQHEVARRESERSAQEQGAEGAAVRHPPEVDQKAGSVPLADCVNDQTAPTPFGPGCWQILFNPPPPPHAAEGPLDLNDTRMQQVWYSNGEALRSTRHGVDAGQEPSCGRVVCGRCRRRGRQGRQGAKERLPWARREQPVVSGNCHDFGRPGHHGVHTGRKRPYPSAAYATIDKNGVGEIHVAAAGAWSTGRLQ